MTDEEILAALPFKRVDAENYDGQKCWKCKEYMIYCPHDHAVFTGHIYSGAGLSEAGISGVCEWCFDDMLGDDE